ncbi:hypothetical protein B0H14DRAFT_2349518 [Mycena olivaceomarginata]|nr:hypothetical protein B0H14DRAFT_2386324 [Mycena olivaceomarginata]KAJ7856972.1 hypothetical protein B0H14DRAFT_2352466 [Mycena olivaceomarginata]KAJ7862519.1 hypothetical protein B0H14DRAFT_2349518 [Mycena olivaceomarginata]
MPRKWHLDGGWASSPSSELILWLPPANRDILWTQPTKLIIGRSQTRILFDNFVYGTEWKNCYIGQQRSIIM